MKDKMKPGDEYEVVVKRGEEELTFTGVLFGRMDNHVLEVDENSKVQQTTLREIWSKNLELN